MPNFSVKFFNTLLGSEGHPFKVLQRVVKVRNAKTAKEATEAAHHNFEELEHVPDWKLHASCCEVEDEKEDEKADV